MPSVRLGLSALCAGLLIPSAFGAQQPRTTFRVSTRLVQVSVIVQDNHGQPVIGLGRDDFRLLEDGREQPIELFSVESNLAAPADPAPLPSNSFSNRLAPTTGGVTVILLDRLNTSWEDQTFARDQVVRFLGQLQRDDRVALYVLDGTVRVLHDFTSDTASLLRALSRYDGRTSKELAAVEDALDTNAADSTLPGAVLTWLKEVDQRISNEFMRDRVRLTTSALEAIANRLAGVRGRKNLIWVSSAFPITLPDGSSFSDEVTRATRALSSANIALYPVDSRGLIGAISLDPRTKTPVFNTMATTRPSIETMQIVAEDTGGRAFYHTNDISRAIRRAVDDSRVTYLLGYYPSHVMWDGRFRRIEVKVNRRGVQLRHRRGYLAAPAQPRDETSRKETLRDALHSPLEATGVGLTVRLDSNGTPAAGKVDVTVGIDPRAVTLDKEGERWIGTVDVLIAQGLPDGTLEVGSFVTLGLNFTTEQRDQAMQQGLTLTRSVTLRDDAHQLRVVARDVPSGVTGSLVVAADKLRKALQVRNRKVER